VSRLGRFFVSSCAGSTDFQPFVVHLDHVTLLELAAAAGLDLTVHQDLSGLDQDLRLAARPDQGRGFERLAEGRAPWDLQRGRQLRDGSRIGMIRYRKSGSSPFPFSSGTMRPGLSGSLSLKTTFSESIAETPSSR